MQCYVVQAYRVGLSYNNTIAYTCFGNNYRHAAV